MAEILIPYRTGTDDGAELRYGLRSIDKNLHDRHRTRAQKHHLTLVGDLPSWVDADSPHLTYVPWDNSASTKSGNIREAVLRGARSLRTRGVERALFCADDCILLWPSSDPVTVSFGTLATAHVGWARDSLIAVAATGRELRNKHPEVIEPVSYATHSPMPLRVRALIDSLEELEEDSPADWRSYYGNVVQLPAVQVAHDGRIGKTPARWVPGVPWQSSEDSAWQVWAGAAAAELFPAPSRWETK